MSIRQRKNEKAIIQRSKINRSKSENTSKKTISKKATRSQRNKLLQGMPTTRSRKCSNTYRDLRSASIPRKRDYARNYKYYNFSVVKAGQLNLQHYETEPYHSIQGWPNPQPVDLTTLSVVPMTKKKLYREAQWTAPIVRHRHHRCSDKSSKDLIRNAERQELEAKKVARGLNSKGRSWDYSGLEAQFLDDYLEERWDDDRGLRDDVFEMWDYEREREGVCRCDDCVWDRYTWVPSEGDEEVYEGVGTKTPEDDEKDESAAWFEALFDQTSQLIITKTLLDEDTEEWAGWLEMLFDQTSELVSTKTTTEKDTDQWADWFDTLFDQTSQLVDTVLEKRNIIVQKEVADLVWVDVIADADEASDMEWDTACWFDSWNPEWTDYWPSVTKTESESSFVMV